MSFKLQVTKEDLAKASSGGSSYITTSGIYDATVQAVTVDTNEHGSVSLGFYVDLGNDTTQMLYGALPMSNYDNTKVLEGSHKSFGALCTLANVDTETDFQEIDASLPIGKGGAAKDVTIFEDFEGVEVKMWVKFEYYRKKNGEIGEKKVIRAFFRPDDNASVDEILNETAPGVKYEKQEKYFTDIGYYECTADEVKEMIDARRGDGNAPAKPAAPAAKRSKFAK